MTEAQQEQLPRQLQSYPASEWVAEMQSPAQTERRMEHVLAFAPQFGIETARHVLEVLDAQRILVATCFGDEVLSPQVRHLLNAAVDAWLSTRFDWSDLTERYAASLGKTSDQVMQEVHARRETENTPTPPAAPPTPHKDPEDEESPNIGGLSAEWGFAIYGKHMAEMDVLGRITEADSESDTEFVYERFLAPEE